MKFTILEGPWPGFGLSSKRPHWKIVLRYQQEISYCILQWLLQDSFDICIIIFELAGKYWERTLKPDLRMDCSRSKLFIFSHLLSLILPWMCGFIGHPYCWKCPINVTLFICQIVCLSMKLDSHKVRRVTKPGFRRKSLIRSEEPKMYYLSTKFTCLEKVCFLSFRVKTSRPIRMEISLNCKIA